MVDLKDTPQVAQVIDPDTQQIGTIPRAQLHAALDQGFLEATQEDLLHEKYGSTGQQILAGLEGAGEAATFGLAPKAETALGITTNEDINARRALYPGTRMLGQVAGIAGSSLLLPGGGAAGIMEKAGASATKALGLGEEGAGILNQMGAAATHNAVASAVFQTGNEISKMMTSEDPHQSIGTAAVDIGLAGILGGGIGGGLGAVAPLWKAAAGDRMGQLIEDFRGRMKYNIENPDPVGTLHGELSNYYKNITDMAHEVYGAKGLKAQEIEKLMPEMSPKIQKATGELTNKLVNNIAEMRANPAEYPERLVTQYERQVKGIVSAVSDESATPGKIFDSIQTAKQWSQDLSKDMWKVPKFSEEYGFAQKAVQLGKELRPFLEDEGVWGKAGTRQQAINKAFTEFKPTLDDFEKKFTSTVNDERVVDPGKINTYVNQLGKPNAELKKEMLENFINASDKYRTVIGDTHANLGIQSPFQASSLAGTRASLEDIPTGAKLADYMYKKGLARLTGEGIGAGVGGAVGHAFGSGAIGALIGEHALGPFLTSILPAMARPFMDNPAIAGGAKAAIDYGVAISRGETLLNKVSGNLFKAGQEVLPSKNVPTEKEKSKLDKLLKTAQTNPEMLMQSGGELAHYMPNHAQGVAQTSMNASNFMNALRPTPAKKSPLDQQPRLNPMQKAAYDRALTIAQQPLTILQHVKDGTITPHDLVVLKNVYPGLYERMQEKVMSGIIDKEHDEEPIPYRTRLGLSLFLGQPLDSTMTQQSIQMAQPKPQQPMQQQQGQAPRAHSMKNINKLADGFMLPNQARASERSAVS